MSIIGKIFGDKPVQKHEEEQGVQKYAYKDEELVIENVTMRELQSLGLPDYVRVRKMGDEEWSRWGDMK